MEQPDDRDHGSTNTGKGGSLRGQGLAGSADGGADSRGELGAQVGSPSSRRSLPVDRSPVRDGDEPRTLTAKVSLYRHASWAGKSRLKMMDSPTGSPNTGIVESQQRGAIDSSPSNRSDRLESTSSGNPVPGLRTLSSHVDTSGVGFASGTDGSPSRGPGLGAVAGRTAEPGLPTAQDSEESVHSIHDIDTEVQANPLKELSREQQAQRVGREPAFDSGLAIGVRSTPGEVPPGTPLSGRSRLEQGSGFGVPQAGYDDEEGRGLSAGDIPAMVNHRASFRGGSTGPSPGLGGNYGRPVGLPRRQVQDQGHGRREGFGAGTGRMMTPVGSEGSSDDVSGGAVQATFAAMAAQSPTGSESNRSERED